MKVGFVSLGCSKNLVDTEMMIGLFKGNGYEIVTKPEEANIILVNTCGFIELAKEEAINTILEMAEYKKGKCKFLIVTGCLVERYKEELIKELPEVDLFVKFSEYDSIWKQIKSTIGNLKEINEKKSSTKKTKKDSENFEGKNATNCNCLKDDEKLEFKDRIISTGNNFAYVRIADGCDNFCTFCAIPYIRGRFKSRTKEDILQEVKILASQGIREIIIIAQDTTKYGVDIYGKPKLAELLHEISKVSRNRVDKIFVFIS